MRVLILTVIAVLITGTAFAGGVTDENNGNKGNIFVSTGENHGANSVGEWVDASTLPELKGAKGDKGDVGATGATGLQGIQGERGEQGIAGRDGVDGINGLNGQDGINGVDGVNGKDGQQGETGSQGEQGLQGVAGQIGEQGLQGLSGQDGKTGETGAKGDVGKQGQQGIQGERGKGLEDRVELIGEVRLLDTRKTTWSVYAGRDFNNDVNIVGGKVTFKLGRSYEERRLDELESKLNISTTSPTENVEVVPTANGMRLNVTK